MVTLTVSAAALAGLSVAPNFVVATGLLAPPTALPPPCWTAQVSRCGSRRCDRLPSRGSSTYRLLAALSMPVGAELAGLHR